MKNEPRATTLTKNYLLYTSPIEACATREVKIGQELTVLESKDGWNCVEFDINNNHYTGWIHGNI